MSEGWEYKLILWTSSTELRDEGRHPSGRPKSTRYWRSEFHIAQSGMEAEKRLAYSTYDKDEGIERVSLGELLAEFGAEGWELVSETVLDSVVVPKDQGWSNVGTPTQVRWVMKRRAQSQIEPG